MEKTIHENHDMLLRHEERIKTLFARQDELFKLTESVNSLALSVQALVTKTGDIEERMKIVEEGKRNKANTVWACVVTSVISALVSFVISQIL